MNKPSGLRRRGATLEDAILDAAWAELSAHGYAQFTAEAVARGSGTSRTVLHRRWPSRSELAAAAIGRHVRLNPIVVPDLGNVRDELLVLLRKFSDRSPPQLVRLIFEMSEDLIKARSNFIAMRNNVGDFLPVQAVLDRAVTRGEIDASKLTPRLALLPTSLARHEIMMTLEPLSDAAIREIVDQIFLPLVAVERPSGRQKNA